MILECEDIMDRKYDINWTNRIEDIKQWDVFLKSNPRGHCQQVGYWLMSFKEYFGFDFEILIIRDHTGKIIAGLGILIIGIPFFKVLIAPNGPVISKGKEQLFDDIIRLFVEKAKERKAFYCQVNVPVLKDSNVKLKPYTLDNIDEKSVFFEGKSGNNFPYVNCIDGFRPVFIDQSPLSYPCTIKKFSKGTKRNIKLALKNNLEIKYATTEAMLRDAYKVIEDIAELQQYKVRSWRKIKQTLLDLIEQGACIVPCCYYNGEIKGALVVFDIGCRLTYIYGGVLREDQDKKIGHFLHDQMIKLSIEKGYGIYDLGVAGGKGVTRFKEGFGAYHIQTETARYWVLNRVKFFIFRFFELILRTVL